MILNIKNFKFVFVHIPKCGGTSISHCLSLGNEEFYKYNGFRHNTLTQDITFSQKQNCYINPDEIFIFSSVRNPWDRFVSIYHFHRIIKENDYPWIEFCKKHSFLDFIKYGEDNHEKMIVYNTYKEFLFYNGKLKSDYIIDFNNLKNDFALISKLLKNKKKLPKINSTDHKEYRFYYNSYAEESIRKHFLEDIELFKFSFEEPKKITLPKPNFQKIKLLFPNETKIMYNKSIKLS